VRIDAKDIGAQVIGEGANLGVTQLGRIEFARAGGRINTDAVDNSAGVDSSDHEVNIKILLSAAIEQAELKTEDRNDLLASMTEDVAEHVLRHNYDQTRAITFMEHTAEADVDVHTRLMSTMERAGRLDRFVEYLPSSEEMFGLRQQGLGLTRPELSVLLAYAKLWVFDALVDSTTPDDPIFERELYAYFPEALHGFTKPIVSHRLRREIIATRISNEIMDTCGVSFLQRTIEMTGGDFASMALAYETARGIYDLTEFAQSVDELDNNASAELQTALYLEASFLLREQVFHLLNDKTFGTTAEKHGIKSIIQKYRAPVAEFKKALPTILGPEDVDALNERFERWRSMGAPEETARQAAALPALEHALDIVDLASEAGWSNPGVGGLYFAVGRLYQFDTLREKARREPPADHFDRISVRQFAEDLGGLQRALAKGIIAFAGNEPKGAPGSWAAAVLARWEECEGDRVAAFKSAVGELDLAGATSVGKFALFAKRMSGLIGD
jgi:glutamate dehydrogenase